MSQLSATGRIEYTPAALTLRRCRRRRGAVNRSKASRLRPSRSINSASTDDGFRSHGLKRPGPSTERTNARRAVADCAAPSGCPSLSEVGLPVARARRSMKPRVGMRYPPSALAMTGCVVRMAFASSNCVIRERRLAPTNSTPISDFVTVRIYPIGYILDSSTKACSERWPPRRAARISRV